MNRVQPPQPGANLLPVIQQHALRIAVALSAVLASANDKPTSAAEKAPFPPTLVLVDDTVIPAPSLTIAEGRVTGDGVPANLSLDDLRQISTHDEYEYLFSETSFGPAMRVHLRHGGRVWAKKLSIRNEKIELQWRQGPPLQLPIDVIRGLQIVSRNDTDEYERSIAAPPATLDRVLVQSDDGKLTTISGLVESLDADSLAIDVNGVKRSVPREKLGGIVFAQPAQNTKQPRYTVKFRDYSELAGDKITLVDGKGTLELAPQAEARFNWPDVYEVKVRSWRLEYLSDWPTLKEVQTPIVTLPFPAKRDKSVFGGRLQVGALERFEKGLGVHARSVITFATEGKWDTFKAKIGLDDETDGKGDCIFQVLADGKSIFRERKTGRDFRATEVELPITGCQEITLLVEPGEHLDLADHANWCDARLIRNKK